MESELSNHKKLTAMGLLIAIGIVFGDIGTSLRYAHYYACKSAL